MESENEEEELNAKVLGIIWNNKEDNLIISFEDKINEALDKKVTKRSILETVAGFFDPLGSAQPLIIQLKHYAKRLLYILHDMQKGYCTSSMTLCKKVTVRPP